MSPNDSPSVAPLAGPATYEEWNAAIIEYFTSNVPRGSPVYLNVDERALLAIRRTLLRRPDATLHGSLN